MHIKPVNLLRERESIIWLISKRHYQQTREPEGFWPWNVRWQRILLHVLIRLYDAPTSHFPFQILININNIRLYPKSLIHKKTQAGTSENGRWQIDRYPMVIARYPSKKCSKITVAIVLVWLYGPFVFFFLYSFSTVTSVVTISGENQLSLPPPQKNKNKNKNKNVTWTTTRLK